MLDEFFIAIESGNTYQADCIAIEIAEIAEECARSKAVALEKSWFAQDQILDSMERTFSRTFSTIHSPIKAKKLFDLTYAWACSGKLSIEEQCKIASVQQFVLSGLEYRMSDLEIEKKQQEIESLIKLCDDYNETLCHDHLLALDAVRGDRALSETVGNAVYARAHAFISMRNALLTKNNHEEKIKQFVNLSINFHNVMLENPMEEAVLGRFEKFARNLRWISCLGQNNAIYANKSYLQFSNTIIKIIEDKVNNPAEYKF